MFTVLAILDSIIIGMIVFYLIAFLFGNKPLVRLLKLLLGVVAGVLYFWLCAELNYGELATEVSMATGCLVFFGPVAIVVILLVIGYMFKDS